MNIKNKIMAGLASLSLLALSASAAVDTKLSGGVTDIGTFWGTVYDLKLLVAIGLLGIVWFKKLR